MDTPPPKWQETTLGEICEFRYGKGLPKAKRRTGEHLVYGSNGVVGHHDVALTKGPTIIVGRKGSLGEVHFSETPCWPIDTTYYVDASATSADLNWLTYCLRNLRLTEMNRAAAIPGLNRNDAYARRVFLPPLSEQERIAAILDQADAIRRKRQAELTQVDPLIQGIFMDTVGPKAHGYDRWPRCTIQEVAAKGRGSMRTGPFGSALRHSEFVDQGIAVLGIDNAVQNRFTWGQRRYITEEKYEGFKRYAACPGDVIVTIMGTIGRSAVLPDDLPTAITTKHLACITLNRGIAEPEFISNTIRRHPEVLRQLGMSQRGAIMDGLNLSIIKALKVPLPPIAVQQEFSRRLSLIRALESKLTQAATEANDLFHSLIQRAFKGDL